jgi:hypothetical protein
MKTFKDLDYKVEVKKDSFIFSKDNNQDEVHIKGCRNYEKYCKV